MDIADIVAEAIPPITATRAQRNTDAGLVEWNFDAHPGDNVTNTRHDAAAAAHLKERCLLDHTADPVAEARRLSKEGWEVGRFTLSFVLDMLRKQNRLSDAVVLADRMFAAGYHHGTGAHTTIPVVYARAGDRTRLRTYFKKTKKRPTLQFLNELALVMIENGEGALCASLLEVMRDFGIVPDDIFFGTVLSRLSDSTHRTLFLQAMAARRHTRSASVLRRQLCGASKRGDLCSASEAFDALLVLSPQKSTTAVTEKDWTILLTTAARAADLPSAKRIVSRAQDFGITTTASAHMTHSLLRCYEGYMQYAADSEVATLLAEVDALYEEARTTLGRAFDIAFFATVMVAIYAGGGDKQRAARFVKEMSKKHALCTPRQLNYTALVKGRRRKEAKVEAEPVHTVDADEEEKEDAAARQRGRVAGKVDRLLG